MIYYIVYIILEIFTRPHVSATLRSVAEIPFDRISCKTSRRRFSSESLAAFKRIDTCGIDLDFSDSVFAVKVKRRPRKMCSVNKIQTKTKQYYKVVNKKLSYKCNARQCD